MFDIRIKPLLFYTGHLEICKMLVKEGASVNAKNLRQSTPLHNACFGGHSEVATLLVEKDVCFLVFF